MCTSPRLVSGNASSEMRIMPSATQLDPALQRVSGMFRSHRDSVEMNNAPNYHYQKVLATSRGFQRYDSRTEEQVFRDCESHGFIREYANINSGVCEY
jgi:hypothetical protein